YENAFSSFHKPKGSPMSLNKQFAPQPTNRALPARPPTDFYQRVTALLTALLLRPWVRNYMLSRHVQMAIDAAIAVLSFALAHILRFDGWPPGVEHDRTL